MFFRKKASEETITKSSIKKMDAVVTGVILGGVIGSIYGIKKLRERQEHDKHDANQTDLFETVEPKKKSFWKRIFSRR